MSALVRGFIVALAATLCVACALTAQERPQRLCEHTMWSRVVTLASEGGNENRAAVQEIARGSDPQIAQLAQFVLDAWSSTSAAHRVKSPQLVAPRSIHFTPKEAETLGQVEATTVAANVTVTANGCVQKLDLLRGPAGPLRDAILDRLRSAVFFPAYDGKRLVQGTSTIRVTVDVR